MEDLALQMDSIREELCRLLDLYEHANPEQQRAIARRCEQLGGQVQDLVGMLKFSLLQMRREAESYDDGHQEYADQVDEVTRVGLQTIHTAGQEVARAIRFLREVWDESVLAEGDLEWLE
jgi:hypothetical protein